jgi:hypothetical protein
MIAIRAAIDNNHHLTAVVAGFFCAEYAEYKVILKPSLADYTV